MTDGFMASSDKENVDSGCIYFMHSVDVLGVYDFVDLFCKKTINIHEYTH